MSKRADEYRRSSESIPGLCIEIEMFLVQTQKSSDRRDGSKTTKETCVALCLLYANPSNPLTYS